MSTPEQQEVEEGLIDDGLEEIKVSVYFSPETLIHDLDSENYADIFLEKTGIEHIWQRLVEWTYDFVGVNDENLLEFEVIVMLEPEKEEK